LFEAYGQVLQVVAKRSDRMRGQAFVVFKEVAEATVAKNNLNGYPIFGKPMVDLELTLENTLRSQTQQIGHFRLKMILSIHRTIKYNIFCEDFAWFIYIFLFCVLKKP
jgi:RNA recognition motif-containing protein